MLRHRSSAYVRGGMGAGLMLAFGLMVQAQTVVYQEGFETDGAGTRYTVVGGEVFEVPRIQSELQIQDQLGPIYWSRSSDVSFVGVPGATAERRALFTWHHTIDPGATPVSSEFLTLVEGTVDWLTRNKTSGTVLWSAEPTATGDLLLRDKLTAMGFTHQTDNVAQALPAASSIALVVKTSAGDGGNPSRFSQYAVPMIAYNAADLDDELISSIGQSALSLDIPTINVADHPAAGGLSGEVPLITGGATSFDTIGDVLPENAFVLASYDLVTPFAVNSLEITDQIIDGTLPSTENSYPIFSADIWDTEFGVFLDNNVPPAPTTDTYVLRGTGRLQVGQAGTYKFALGVDDGGRFRIDQAGDGFDDSDNVVVVDSTGAFRWTVGTVTLAQGTHDFEFVMFDAGGEAGLEIAVATSPSSPNDAVAPPDWELLGDVFGTTPITLDGDINLVTYSPTELTPTTQTRPFIVLLEAGADGGLVLSGGPFVGQEGSAFWGGSGMNKWTLPTEQYRTIRLNPIDLTGKTDLYLTMAAAGTFLDFETSDFLEVHVDPDGSGPAAFQRIVRFTAPSGSDKFFDDRTTNPETPTRLGLRFKDVTYALPDGMTQAVFEVRAFSSWWNEILAFDNIRITEGAPSVEIPTVSLARDGGGIRIEFTGTLEMTTDLPGGWTEVQAGGGVHTIPAGSLEPHAFFRARQ